MTYGPTLESMLDAARNTSEPMAKMQELKAKYQDLVEQEDEAYEEFKRTRDIYSAALSHLEEIRDKMEDIDKEMISLHEFGEKQ